MSKNDTSTDGSVRINREAITMKAGVHGPILDIGGVEIGLDISYYGGGGGLDSKAEAATTEIDSNGDFSWWIVYDDEDLSNYVEIVPEALSE